MSIKICKRCKKSFESHIWINGKRRNLQNRIYCFECSPFGLHNTRKIHKLEHIAGNGGKEKFCIKCEKNLPITNFYVKGSSKRLCTFCKSCQIKYTVNRLKEKRRIIIF